MKSNALATWGLAGSILLAASGSTLGWAAVVTDQSAGRQVLLLVAVVLCAAAISLLVWTASARVARDADRRKLQKYACPRCGYAPEPEQVESAPSMPCPACGQPLYAK